MLLPPELGVDMHPHWAFVIFIDSVCADDVLVQMDLFPSTILRMVLMSIGTSLYVVLQISFYR